MIASQGFPWRPPSSLWLDPCGCPHFTRLCSVPAYGGFGSHPPMHPHRPGRPWPFPHWSGWTGMLTAEVSLGMVLAPGDKGSPQWHLGSMQQECPLQSLRASVLEWHLELLLDLLLGLDALLWPLCAEPSFPCR